MINNIELVVLSFLASFGFGIVFRIERKFLIWAGLGGALTRIVYLALMAVTDSRAIYMLFAAMFAALYAQLISPHLKTPSTEFLYPSIIPLIPGDLLYYSIVGVMLKDGDKLNQYGYDCLTALFCMCLGFVLISTLAHYSRRYKLKKKIMTAGFEALDHVIPEEASIEEAAKYTDK